MRVVPRSHLNGAYKVRDAQQNDGSILTQSVLIDDSMEETAVYFEMRAGQMSLHSDLLLHGSSANNSNRRRCALALRYAAADVRCTTLPPTPPFTPLTLKATKANQVWNYASVHCEGGDPSGHWADIPRPVDDDVSFVFGDNGALMGTD